MPGKASKKKKFVMVPGILIEYESGGYLAYYEHRSDIIANGQNEKEAKKNLKKMYQLVKKLGDTKLESEPLVLPKEFKVKSFTEKF